MPSAGASGFQPVKPDVGCRILQLSTDRGLGQRRDVQASRSGVLRQIIRNIDIQPSHTHQYTHMAQCLTTTRSHRRRRPRTRASHAVSRSILKTQEQRECARLLDAWCLTPERPASPRGAFGRQLAPRDRWRRCRIRRLRTARPGAAEENLPESWTPGPPPPIRHRHRREFRRRTRRLQVGVCPVRRFGKRRGLPTTAPLAVDHSMSSPSLTVSSQSAASSRTAVLVASARVASRSAFRIASRSVRLASSVSSAAIETPRVRACAASRSRVSIGTRIVVVGVDIFCSLISR